MTNIRGGFFIRAIWPPAAAMWQLSSNSHETKKTRNVTFQKYSHLGASLFDRMANAANVA